MRIEYFLDQVGCVVGAERLGQHRADKVVGTQADGRELFGIEAEFFHHIDNLLARYFPQFGHCHAHPLGIAVRQLLNYRSGLVFTQRHQQDRAFY